MTTAKARKPKLPKPLEREIQSPGIDLMNRSGWRMFRRNVGAFKFGDRYFRAAEPGQSDSWGWIRHLGCRHVECEFKRPGERPTYEQVMWLLGAHSQGGVAIWVDSLARLEEVIRHINAGGAIRYLDTTRTYSVKIKGKKKPARVEGPSGDYELV